MIWDVQVPAVLPELLGALRVTSVMSLGIAIVVEYMVSPQGIGRVMKFAISYSSVDLILVGIIWAIAIAYLIDFILVLIFAYVLRWSTRGKAELKP